jgi:hypothetical protein
VSLTSSIAVCLHIRLAGESTDACYIYNQIQSAGMNLEDFNTLPICAAFAVLRRKRPGDTGALW